jgi:uncharacterized protein YodC (DUF2158 family)
VQISSDEANKTGLTDIVIHFLYVNCRWFSGKRPFTGGFGESSLDFGRS